MTDSAVAAFGQERDRLFGLAYRMTSSVMDADDVVQETWVRFDRALEAGDEIQNVAAFLTTVATRLCLDRLRSAEKRRVEYVGPWLPEPILTDRDPSHVVELDETIRLGFLHVLDSLGPVDRAVFLLHDVFGNSYVEVAETVGRTEANCRQIARRARDRVRTERPTPVSAAGASDEALLQALLEGIWSGDAEQLEALLAADVVLVNDGGPKVRAARNKITTPYRLARFLIGISKQGGDDGEFALGRANGGVALLLLDETGLDHLWEVEFADGLVKAIHGCMNPDKLSAARAAW